MRVLLLLLLLNPLCLVADELCGPADQTVCLESVIPIGLTGVGTLLEGTTVVFRIPGMESGGAGVITGSPERAYRFGDPGTVIDEEGGVWSTVTLAEDEKGVTAQGYVLESGSLSNALITLIINQLQVCQQISDPPTEVTLAFNFWLVIANKISAVEGGNKRLDEFAACVAYSGNLPVLASSKAYLTNVHEDPVLVTTGDTSRALAPGEQMVVDQSNTSPTQISSSLALPVVYFSETGDIDVVALEAGKHTHFFLPHTARDTQSWDNRYVFATGERTTVDWLQGALRQQTTEDAGVHTLAVAPDEPPVQGWARVLANRGINGFFQFSRNDGLQGSAWVAPQPTDAAFNLTASTLYLPHVAADRVSFWTGYSLANVHEADLAVTMTGYDTGGLEVAVEQFTIHAGGNEVGVIGATRFAGNETVSWVRIDADRPFAGLQLVGGNGGDPALSGFALPHSGADQLSFPLLRTDLNFWSGAAVLNASDRPVNGTVTWKDAGGNTIDSEPFSLNAWEKKTWSAPDGAVQAAFQGRDLVGFCLIGELTSGRLGGYLGQMVTSE